MSTAELTDWTAAVAVEDVPIAVLSDDEYEALWTPERLEIDPDCGPALAPGLRGLLARELATLTDDGAIELSGAAGLVRQARAVNLGLAVLRLVDHDRQWFLIESGVVLEQRRPTPGGFTFVLRSLKRAVREVVDEVVPTGPPEGEQWSFGPEDPRERWAALEAEHPRVCSVDVIRPVLGQDAGVAQRVVLLSDGSRPGWCAFTAHDLRTTVTPATPGGVRRLLLDLLDGEGLDVPDVPRP